MKNVLAQWLSALLIACLLIPAPLALMEADMIEPPPEEVGIELSEADPAPNEPTEAEEPAEDPEPDEAETAEDDALEDQVAESIIEENDVRLESDPVDAELAATSDEPLFKDADRFPDPTFRACLVNFDENGDGHLSDSEIATVKKLDLSSVGIDSLKGIEYFTNLAYLRCERNHLKELDVSNNTELWYLDCSVNYIRNGLDVSKNTKLQTFLCFNNALTDLKLGYNNNLRVLVAWWNSKLKTIDISGCPILLTAEIHLGEHLGEEEFSGESDTYTAFYGIRDRGEKWLVVDKSVKLITEDNTPVIKLTKNQEASLSFGDTVRLDLGGAPVKSYTSSNTSVATVNSSGIVNAYNEGKATITVNLGSSKRKLKLTVDDPTMPKAIKLDPSGTFQQDLYQSFKMKYTLEPKDTAVSEVTWKCSNPKVATMIGSVVIPQKEGTVTITATATRNKKCTAKLTLVIYDSKIPKGIHLDRTGTVPLDVTDDKTLNLTATLEPSTASGFISWNSSAPKIASVENGVVTIHKAGSATITATVDEIRKKAKVKLVIKDMHAPKAVTITQGKKLTIPMGMVARLTAEVIGEEGYAPRSDVTWKSSKPKVVSVDQDGYITALSPGSATITVTAEKKKATIKIKVPK